MIRHSLRSIRGHCAETGAPIVRPKLQARRGLAPCAIALLLAVGGCSGDTAPKTDVDDSAQQFLKVVADGSTPTKALSLDTSKAPRAPATFTDSQRARMAEDLVEIMRLAIEPRTEEGQGHDPLENIRRLLGEESLNEFDERTRPAAGDNFQDWLLLSKYVRPNGPARVLSLQWSDRVDPYRINDTLTVRSWSVALRVIVAQDVISNGESRSVVISRTFVLSSFNVLGPAFYLRLAWGIDFYGVDRCKTRREGLIDVANDNRATMADIKRLLKVLANPVLELLPPGKPISGESLDQFFGCVA